MDIFINCFVAVISGLISWKITDIYYKKSLEDQAKHWSNIESKLLLPKEQDIQHAQLMLYEQRMQTAMQDYKKRGTPKNTIDTFDNLSKEEKAKMYDDVLLRSKGRKGKNNPYR